MRNFTQFLSIYSDLLTIPPGFSEGLTLDDSSPPSTASVEQTTEATVQSVSISELLFGNESGGAAQFIDWGEDEEESKAQVDKEDDVSA